LLNGRLRGELGRSLSCLRTPQVVVFDVLVEAFRNVCVADEVSLIDTQDR
jgi:hypothetical protein